MEGWKTTKNGLLDLEVFKEAFLDGFFPLEWREKKMVEFMNLHQGGMSVKECSLKFTQLSKYAPAMVANPRSRMSKFFDSGV